MGASREAPPEGEASREFVFGAVPPGESPPPHEPPHGPVIVVTDDDYRCVWRPCEALEEEREEERTEKREKEREEKRKEELQQSRAGGGEVGPPAAMQRVTPRE